MVSLHSLKGDDQATRRWLLLAELNLGLGFLTFLSRSRIVLQSSMSTFLMQLDCSASDFGEEVWRYTEFDLYLDRHIRPGKLQQLHVLFDQVQISRCTLCSRHIYENFATL